MPTLIARSRLRVRFPVSLRYGHIRKKNRRNCWSLGLAAVFRDRKSTRLNSSHLGISYAVFRDIHSFPTRRSSDLGEWQSDISREMTIQIMPAPGRDLDANVNRAVAIARAISGVAEVRPYSKEESTKLLEPWLGSGISRSEERRVGKGSSWRWPGTA